MDRQTDPFRIQHAQVWQGKRRRRTVDTNDSIWFRPIRALIQKGVPAMPITVLLIDVEDDVSYPIGALCRTQRGRLILWPLKNTGVRNSPERERVMDHVTLEIASGKTHQTGYNGTEPWRENIASIEPVDGQPMSFWLANVVDWSTIRREPKRPGIWVTSPTADQQRRKRELANYGRQLRMHRLSIARRPSSDSFLLSYFYLVHDGDHEPEVPEPFFPSIRTLLPDIEDQGTELKGAPLEVGATRLVWMCGWVRGSTAGSTLIVPDIQRVGQ